jgi:6-phosphofructokinase 1
VLVAQSGGPSPVVNSSLLGVIDACRAYPDRLGHIYGGWHGIEGVLKEELLDLSAQPERELRLLATTPAAGAIGTCRYKLREEHAADFERILDVLAAHDVGYFFYIGGNDSMDTADKVSRLAAARGMELTVTGIPKTIDNDVGDPAFQLIDHTPGYGSVARYWAYAIQNANEENAGFAPAGPVLVLQAMGRTVGFIPAAARLGDPHREMPLQIYMPEAGIGLEEMADRVNDELKHSGRCIVVISEGFDVGDIGAVRDAFGHVEFGASTVTAQQAVVTYLNHQGLAARGPAMGQLAGTDQRSTSIHASTVDLAEAYEVGRHAITVALKAGSGWMSTMLREPGPTYRIRYAHVPLRDIANCVRHLPTPWLAPSRVDVTDAFVQYARPLIGDGWPAIPLENGLQRFARFCRLFAEKKCPSYIPQTYR